MTRKTRKRIEYLEVMIVQLETQQLKLAQINEAQAKVSADTRTLICSLIKHFGLEYEWNTLTFKKAGK